MKLKALCCALILFTCHLLQAQVIEITGKVTDENQKGIPFVNVIIAHTQFGVSADEFGRYEISIDENYLPKKNPKLVFQSINYKTDTLALAIRKNTYTYKYNVQLQKSNGELDTVVIKGDNFISNASETFIDPKNLEFIAAPVSSVEHLVMHEPGVASRSELSNQYSVRGGNFDENLVYVNDFEIYRPFLIRSGQQEGLSFINPDLVGGITFSAGGFEAKYGDKMSSVLQIDYKRPTDFHGSVTASLLGAQAHIEGSTKPKEDKASRFMYLMGFRYKNNAYLLGSLDQKGEYTPNNLDFQTDLIWRASEKFEVEGLFNISNNKYNFNPLEQSTTTGSVNQVIRLSVFFDGSEQNYFQNLMGGLAFKYAPNDRLSFKWLTSAYRMTESENFNIIGEYRLDEIESDFSSDEFGEVKATLGVGTFHDWGRNELDAFVNNYTWKGNFVPKNERHLLSWGSKFQIEKINDKLSEWERLDSAGYSLPYTGEQVTIFNTLKSKANLDSWRIQGFIQDQWNIKSDPDYTQVKLTTGVRYHYWNQNKEFLASPRLQLNVIPTLKKDSIRQVIFKFATGLYHQAPFYREVRALDGSLNTSVKAQKSLHVVLGSEYNFKAWDRPFKFTSELYYKHMWDLNTYEVDDVRIRYFGNNDSKGYAAGVDLRLFGEFVKGTDSWVSLSIMQTKENLLNDSYLQYLNAAGDVINGASQDAVAVDSNTIYPGYIPRPTDQRLMLGLYFSDYLTKNDNFKMHLSLHLGTSLPFGPPDAERYKDILRSAPYRRVDIGFSVLLLSPETRLKKGKTPSKAFDKIWLSAEIFNLLGISNTLSYRWIKDVRNNQWPLPNYLTSRRFNVKLHANF